MIIEKAIKKNGRDTGWYNLQNGDKTLQAQIERFDTKSSEYGINGGRISKLFVVENGKGWGERLYSYDRRLEKNTSDKKVKEFVNEIIRKYN